MKLSRIAVGLAPALFIAFALSACNGSSGGGGGDGDPDPGPAPSNPDPDPDPSTDPRSACQQDFSTARASSETQECAPRYFDFCPSVAGGQVEYDDVPGCDGVRVDIVSESHPDSFSGTMDYIVMRPTDSTPRAAVVSLHFRQLLRSPRRAAATHATLMRLAELVRGRDVMIILPGAPNGNWPQSTASDIAGDLTSGIIVADLIEQLLESGLISGDLLDNPIVDELVELGIPVDAVQDLLQGLGTIGDLAELIGTLTPSPVTVEDHLDYIDLAMEDAFDRFGGRELPRFMNGLSNGGIYALRYACRRGGLEGVMAVAASVGPVEGWDCQDTLAERGESMGTVQVHGRLDVMVPYGGVILFPVRGGPPALAEGLEGLPVLGELLTGLGLLDALLPDSGLMDGLIDGVLGGLFEGLLPGDNPLEPLQDLLENVLSLGGLLTGLISGPEQPGLFLDVFGPNNACDVDDINTTVLPAGIAGRGTLAGDVTIEEFASCDNPRGMKNYMVTVERGGHNWPGYDAPSDADANVFGPISRDFDATLYGFDLLWAASGR